jgi:hypothetical protein
MSYYPMNSSQAYYSSPGYQNGWGGQQNQPMGLGGGDMIHGGLPTGNIMNALPGGDLIATSPQQAAQMRAQGMSHGGPQTGFGGGASDGSSPGMNGVMTLGSPSMGGGSGPGAFDTVSGYQTAMGHTPDFWQPQQSGSLAGNPSTPAAASAPNVPTPRSGGASDYVVNSDGSTTVRPQGNYQNPSMGSPDYQNPYIGRMPGSSDWVNGGASSMQQMPPQQAAAGTAGSPLGPQPRMVPSPDGNGLTLDTGTGKYYNQSGDHTYINQGTRQEAGPVGWGSNASPNLIASAYTGQNDPFHQDAYNTGAGQPFSHSPNPFAQGQLDAGGGAYAGPYSPQYYNGWGSGWNSTGADASDYTG